MPVAKEDRMERRDGHMLLICYRSCCLFGGGAKA
jgi:hypothetical protein